MTYISKMSKENKNRPVLVNWTISEFTTTEFKLRLNLTITLYVSSTYDPDELLIVVLLPFNFKTFDDQYLSENYTMTTALPSMGKASEMEALVQTAE